MSYVKIHLKNRVTLSVTIILMTSGHLNWWIRRTLRVSKTAPFVKVKAGLSPDSNVKLCELVGKLLGERIQRRKHDSIEDAKATMQLYRLVEDEWERNMQYEEAWNKLQNAPREGATSCFQSLWILVPLWISPLSLLNINIDYSISIQ